MIGRFLIGALTGLLLVVSGMVVTSPQFPLRASSGPEADDPSAGTAETEAEPIVAPEPSPEPTAEVAAVDTAEPAVEEPTEAPDAEEPAASAPAEEPAEEAAEATVAVTEEAPAVEPAATEEATTEAAPVVAEVTAPEAPAAPEALAEPAEDATASAAEATATVPATETAAAGTETAATTEAPAAATETASTEAATAEAAATGTEAAAAPSATTETASVDSSAAAPASGETEVATAATTEAAPAAAEDAKAAPATEVAEATVVEPAPAPTPVPETSAATEPAAEPEAEVATAPETAEPAAQPEAEVAAAEDESTFTPTPGFAADETLVTEGEEATAETASVEATPEAPVDDRPIAKFASAFENPEGKPVLSIVLVDLGEADLDRAGLAALPFPVTFALDPMDQATPANAAIYRAAGREVVMLATGIAEGAQASDVEVAFEAMSKGLPEAVAVMDLEIGGFQDNRPLASLVVPVIGGQGRGVLSWDKGLNAADQVARREDIASAVIFRDLAVGGGDAAAAKRTLDRAVFKAGQDGRVVVAGAATPDLVAALLEWSVEGRAGSVAIAPLTAVLQVD